MKNFAIYIKETDRLLIDILQPFLNLEGGNQLMRKLCEVGDKHTATNLVEALTEAGYVANLMELKRLSDGTAAIKERHV